MKRRDDLIILMYNIYSYDIYSILHPGDGSREREDVRMWLLLLLLLLRLLLLLLLQSTAAAGRACARALVGKGTRRVVVVVVFLGFFPISSVRSHRRCMESCGKRRFKSDLAAFLSFFLSFLVEIREICTYYSETVFIFHFSRPV